MAGFGPVGSFQVGAYPSAGAAGVRYELTSATVVFQGSEPIATYTGQNTKVTSFVLEVLEQPNPDAIITSFVFEVLEQPNPDARVTMFVFEVLESIEQNANRRRQLIMG